MQADVGLNSYDFYARAPGISTKKYTVRVYDDVILAPYVSVSACIPELVFILF